MSRLKDKVAIITGGGSGIGRGAALALAQEGAYIIVCGRRQQRLDETVQIILQSGGRALSVQADVSNEPDVIKVMQTVMAAHGTIDILINNAGVIAGNELYQLESSDWDRVMQTNLRGPFLMTRHALPVMRGQRSGHIINISSESGIAYYPNDTAYGVSKHALIAFAEYTQIENQDFNIRVNTICPGMVVTEMSENEAGLNHNKCLYPEDIADLIVWLLTRRANIKIGTPILIQTMLNPWE